MMRQSIASFMLVPNTARKTKWTFVLCKGNPIQKDTDREIDRYMGMMMMGPVLGNRRCASFIQLNAKSHIALDLFYFYLHEFKSQDWSTCAYSPQRFFFFYLFVEDKFSHFGDKKIPSANWTKGVFLGKNAQKSPYFEEIQLEVAYLDSEFL
jgi:hypothetical protein